MTKIASAAVCRAVHAAAGGVRGSRSRESSTAETPRSRHLSGATPETVRPVAPSEEHGSAETEPPACFSIDWEGRITGWTQAAEELVGWSAAQAIGRRVDDLLIASSSWVSYHAELTVLEQTPRAAGWLRVYVYHRDGQHLPVMLALTKVLDPGAGLHAVMRPGHSSPPGRPAAREYLLLRSVLHALPGVDGVVACDAGGHLWLMTGAMEELFGPVEGRAEDGSWSLRVAALRHGDGRLMLRHELPLVRALRGETVVDYPFVVDPIDGPRRAFLTSGSTLPDAGLIEHGAIVTAQEIAL